MIDGVMEKFYLIGNHTTMNDFPVSYSPDFYSRQYYMNDVLQHDAQE